MDNVRIAAVARDRVAAWDGVVVLELVVHKASWISCVVRVPALPSGGIRFRPPVMTTCESHWWEYGAVEGLCMMGGAKTDIRTEK